METVMAFFYAGTAWFCLFCVLFECHLLVRKKAEYLLFMTIRGAQREDAEVKWLVRAFKKEALLWAAGLFAATGVFFLLSLLPVGRDSAQICYFSLWVCGLLLAEYGVVRKYANRMYTLKINKGWGMPPRQGSRQVDTIVSRKKKTLPVSELWLAVPLWICIGSFLWWGMCATEYKILLTLLVTNVATFLLFCYLFHRIAHGKCKVYSEDSELNYILNRVSKRAWSGCMVWEAALLCGHQFVITLLLHSHMKRVAAGAEGTAAAFWIPFVGSIVAVSLLTVLAFLYAANRVRQTKKELAAATEAFFAEDCDAYWKNGYYFNPNDTDSFVENRVLGITVNMATRWGTLTKWCILLALLFCIGLGVALLPFDLGSVTAKEEKDGIAFRACLYYSEKLPFSEVSEVVFLTERPTLSRVAGTGTKRFALGSYRFCEYGNGTAMIDREAECFLLVKKQDGAWFGFSVKDEEEMQGYYEVLRAYATKNSASQTKK